MTTPAGSPRLSRVDKILGSWIRGQHVHAARRKKVYGYIYDAGSDGGAGMNRFGEIVLGTR